MQIDDLKRVDEWAAQRIGSHNETPWDWYQLMKLREALEALISSQENRLTLQTEATPGSERHLEKHLQLVGDTHSQDSVPLRKDLWPA